MAPSRVEPVIAKAQSNASTGQISGIAWPLQADQKDLKAFVVSQSVARNLNPGLTTCIVQHESQWNPTKPGDDGQSMGLWQISKIWHPEVPEAVSLSPVSSTLWALDWIASGHIRQWSTFAEYCKNYPVFLK